MFVGCPNGCDVALDDTGTPTEKICLTCPEFEDCVMACPDYETWIAAQRERIGAPAEGVADATPAPSEPDLPEPSHFKRKTVPGSLMAQVASAVPGVKSIKKRKPLVKIDGANATSIDSVGDRVSQRLKQLTVDRGIPLDQLEILITRKVDV